MASQKSLCSAFKHAEIAEVQRLRLMTTQGIARRKLALLAKYFGSHAEMRRAVNVGQSALDAQEFSATTMTRIDRAFRDVLSLTLLGQVRKAKQNKTWIDQRAKIERAIGMPPRVHGKQARKIYPANERDTRLHPLLCAVRRAVREGYEIPDKYVEEFSDMTGMTIDELQDYDGTAS